MIVTSRCELMILNSEDFEEVRLLYIDPTVRKYLGGTIDDEFLLKKKFDEIMTSSSSPGFYYWSVRLAENHKFLGLVSLDDYHDGKNIELSYQFLSEYWGKGYATEVVKKLIDYSFNDLELPKLVSETQTANIASCRLLERVGMRLENKLVRFGTEQSVYSVERS